MATLSPIPAFVHDCDRCRLLANVTTKAGKVFDVYVCQAGSVVARTADNGPEYVSAEPALFDMYEKHQGTEQVLGQAIWLARREAWVRGLLDL